MVAIRDECITKTDETSCSEVLTTSPSNCYWNKEVEPVVASCGEEVLVLRDPYNLVFNIKGSKSYYLKEFDLNNIW